MTHIERIKNLMQPSVKLTADEIAGALDLPVTSVRPRVSELYSQGWLTMEGGSKKNRRGNVMWVWVRSE